MVPGFNNNTIWSWPRGRRSQSASPVQTPRQLIVDSAFPASQMLVGYGQLRGRVSIMFVIFFIKHTLYRYVVAGKALLHTGADKLLRSFTHMIEIVWRAQLL
jgi:hypothetical protein